MLVAPGVADAGQGDLVTAASAERSGRVVITGSGFGSPGSIAIGGASAHWTRWTDTAITAYVPESALLGAVTVQILSLEGGEASAPIEVKERPPAGDRVLWRFQVTAPWGPIRSAVAPDGTVYAHDPQTPYALTPDG